MRALAEEASHPVNASRPIEAGGSSAIVDVNAAIWSGPAVDANAGITTDGIGAGGPIVTERWPERALVHVNFALSSGVRRWTGAIVLIYPVDAGGPILTQVTDAVVDVLFTILTSKSCKK